MNHSLPKLFLAGALMVATSLLSAQDLKHCGTTEMMNKLYADHPELLQLQEQYDQDIREYTPSTTRDDEGVFVIPIVFHVIHNYGSEHISDAQVEDEVRILNDDYRKLNADTAAIVNAFLGIAADAKVEFRLAQKTPGWRMYEWYRSYRFS
jgi:hypothetical protein